MAGAVEEVHAVFAEVAAAAVGMRAGRFFGMPALMTGRSPLAFVDGEHVVVRRAALPATSTGEAWVDPRGRPSAGWALTDARGRSLVALLRTHLRQD